MNELVAQAIEAMQNAYAPYSNFYVGAAIELTNGKIIRGVNVENASYGLTNCAERTALFAVYSQGYKKNDIAKMAIAGKADVTMGPCGACRQVMSELLPDNCSIYLGNLEGEIREFTMKELLPFAFNPSAL